MTEAGAGQGNRLAEVTSPTDQDLAILGSLDLINLHEFAVEIVVIATLLCGFGEFHHHDIAGLNVANFAAVEFVAAS